MGDRAPASVRVVIGLDVGTTAAKVTAFGLGGEWRASVGHEYPLRQPHPGWEVQDPEVIWRAVRSGLAEVAGRLAGAVPGGDASIAVPGGDASVVGIGVSTAMHGLIGLDERQRPVTPLLTWADSRAAEQALRLRDTELGRRLHRQTGTPIHSMSPLTKLIWFAEHDRATVERVRWWVGLKDFLLLRLTGRLVTERSNASGTGLLDLATGHWHAEALATAGVRADQLPPVRPTTEALPLLPAVAADLGLPAELPVVLGAGDGPLGNLGVGALEPGVVGLSLGTSGAVRMVTDRPYVDAGGKLFCYALTDDAWVIGGAISNGGIVVRWSGDLLAADLAQSGSPDGPLLELARAVPIGSDGLVMLPFLMAERAPLWNPSIPGAFLGVRRGHTRAHLARAAVEGVAMMLSTIVDELDRVTPVRQVRATGGVFRSTVWRDVLAAALGKPLVVTDGAEGTALGAAALALYGLGEASSLTGGLALLVPAGTVADDRGSADGTGEVVPDPADVEAYRTVRAGIPALLARYDEVRGLFG